MNFCLLTSFIKDLQFFERFLNFSNFPVMFLNANKELLLSSSAEALLRQYPTPHFLFVEAFAAFLAAFSASIAANLACSFSSAIFWR